MIKTAIFLTAILVSVLAAIPVIELSSEQPIDLVEMTARDREVREKSVNYYCFKRGFDANLDGLANGSLSLRDAHAQVLALTRQYHPDFEAFLEFSDRGSTTEERLARNLIGHIHNISEVRPIPEARLRDLDAQLAEFLGSLPRNESGIRRP